MPGAWPVANGIATGVGRRGRSAAGSGNAVNQLADRRWATERASFAGQLLDQRRQLAGLGGIEAMVGRSGGARAAGERIVRQARGQLGSAYLWGGEEPGRFDCSGLVQWAVKQATGRTLPRVAADQARVGRPVERGRLQAGDLVFFANTDRPGVSHVGIYAGEGRFIHAASPGKGVITSRLDEPYWASHYQSARRVV